MPSVSIESRGVIETDSGSGLTVSVPTIVSASIQVSASVDNRNIMPYPMSTTVLSTNSGTITCGGHYTINKDQTQGSLSGAYVMPTLASSVGSVFVIRNVNAADHILTGSEASSVVAVFTTGSVTGSSVSILSVTAGSRLFLPQSASVVLMNTGDRFAALTTTGGIIKVGV